jgi:transcription elongation factor Elf1
MVDVSSDGATPTAIALLPCPFCGEVPTQPGCFFSEDTHGKWGIVRCTNCGAQAGDVRAQYEPVDVWAPDAAKEWNRRADLPAGYSWVKDEVSST